MCSTSLDGVCVRLHMRTECCRVCRRQGSVCMYRMYVQIDVFLAQAGISTHSTADASRLWATVGMPSLCAMADGRTGPIYVWIQRSRVIAVHAACVTNVRSREDNDSMGDSSGSKRTGKPSARRSRPKLINVHACMTWRRMHVGRWDEGGRIHHTRRISVHQHHSAPAPLTMESESARLRPLHMHPDEDGRQEGF